MRTLTLVIVLFLTSLAHAITLGDLSNEPTTLQLTPDDSGHPTLWLPPGHDSLTLPIAAGITVPADHATMNQWLVDHAPFHLLELPLVAATYGDHNITLILPWPHYAELLVEQQQGGDPTTTRIGIRFTFPPDRETATPAIVVALRTPASPLAPAHAFRAWRESTPDLGGIPPIRTLTQKTTDLPNTKRLFGAPHLYLWGNNLFCRADVPRRQWIPLAKHLLNAQPDTPPGRMTATFTDEQTQALHELTDSDWPLAYLTRTVAGAINTALTDPHWLDQPEGRTPLQIIEHNRAALIAACPGLLNHPDSWGDALSTTLISDLKQAGIEHALLLQSDLTANQPRPDVARAAEDAGYLLGRYDSYHSVHNPDALPDNTWETAQFDRAAYEQGRVINADGTGHSGFKGRGFHLSPRYAHPYVHQRVNAILSEMPQTTWFIDCDAAYEYFDDYSPAHPATRVDDVNDRRQRLAWIRDTHQLVLGSEGGSILFSDLIAYGQGVHTPFVIHLDPAFRDPDSPSFIGRHWPPDAPSINYKPITTPQSVITPFFDPTVRIPLYRAALGDQVITTHHWSFDTLKLGDLQTTRQLLEILYLAAPTYHISRLTWPDRRDTILSHLAFWSPLHHEWASARLTDWQPLTPDHMLQQTTYARANDQLTITVNFDTRSRQNFPPQSATTHTTAQNKTQVYRISRPE